MGSELSKVELGCSQKATTHICVPSGEPHSDTGIKVHESGDDKVDRKHAEVGGCEDVCAGPGEGRVGENGREEQAELEQTSEDALAWLILVNQRARVGFSHGLQEEEMGFVDRPKTGARSPAMRHLQSNSECEQREPPASLLTRKTLG